MASKFTQLRFGLATTLAVAISGSSAYSVVASHAEPIMPSQVLYQQSGNPGQGRVWDPVPRPVAIHSGTITNLGDDVAELNNLIAPDGLPVGVNDRGRAEYAYTQGIQYSLGQLTSDDHVIVVELSELNDKVIAYGHIGGVPDSNGSLVVNLTGDDDDAYVYGVAVLTPNRSNPALTDASIFIMGTPVGEEIGSRTDDDDRDHDNDGRDDDDRDGDGIRDDDGGSDGGSGGSDDVGNDSGGVDDGWVDDGSVDSGGVDDGWVDDGSVDSGSVDNDWADDGSYDGGSGGSGGS